MLPETLILFGLISETEASVVQISAVTSSCATEDCVWSSLMFTSVFPQDFQDSSHQKNNLHGNLNLQIGPNSQ